MGTILTGLNVVTDQSLSEVFQVTGDSTANFLHTGGTIVSGSDWTFDYGVHCNVGTTLSVGGGTTTGEFWLFESSTNGSDKVILGAPDDVPTSYRLNFPPAQGNPGEVLANDGTGQLFWRNEFSRGTGTSTVSSTTYVDITGLSLPIAANETAVFLVSARITGATNGCDFQVTGPASPVAVEGVFECFTSVSSLHSWQPVTAFSTPTGATFASAAVNGTMQLTLSVVNGNNAGTISVQFATKSGTNTITAQANRWIKKL